MTDDHDPSTKAELEQRVNELEQTVQKMLPSRRDALKLGGGALTGAGLMEATTNGAKAGSQSVGTIGTTSDPVDLVAEDITDHNGNDVMELPGDGSVSANRLVSDTLELDDDPTDDQLWALFDDANDLKLNFQNGNLAYPWLSFRNDADVLDIGGSTYDVDLDLNGGNIDNVGSVSTDKLVSDTLELDDDPTDDTLWALFIDDGNDLRLTGFNNENIADPWLSFRLNSDVIDIGTSALDVDLDLNGGNIDNAGSLGTDDVTVGTTLTDASGTSHTGELSDADDVTSGTNTNGNYEINVDGDVYEFVPE